MSDSVMDHVYGDPSAVVQILQALGPGAKLSVDQIREKSGRARSFQVSCPMPDHLDEDPSTSFHQDSATFVCHGHHNTIYLKDLIIAYGQASSDVEAMQFIERVLGIDTEAKKAEFLARAASSGLRSGKSLAPVDDPSLTTEQYAYALNLSTTTVEAFGLRDVLHYPPLAEHMDKKYQQLVMYEPGWYTGVYLDYGPGARPRVRSSRPDGSIKPAMKLREPGSRKPLGDWTGGELSSVLYGMDQLSPSLSQLKQLLIVEGESDVHCLYEASQGQIPVLGVPGVGSGESAVPRIIEQLLIANGGDADLRPYTLVVGSEPGNAGAQFPRVLFGHIINYCTANKIDPPRLRSFNWIELGYGADADDARALWAIAGPDTARVVRAAMNAAAGDAPAALPQSPGPSPEPPLPIAPVPASDSIPAAPPVRPALPVGTIWAELPAEAFAPSAIDGLKSTYCRGELTWIRQKWTDKDKLIEDKICCPVAVSSPLICDERLVVDLHVAGGPMNALSWRRKRIEAPDAVSQQGLLSIIAGMGGRVESSAKADIANIVGSMVSHISPEAIHVSEGTGWIGAEPGSQSAVFSGMDAGHMPLEKLPAKMLRANDRRRVKQPDTLEAARRWWLTCIEPLMSGAQESTILTMGAAAAAPMLASLQTSGSSISPVIWLSGTGGSGKTTLQRIAGGIFAPPGGGQNTFFISSNFTAAAIGARALSSRDLPLIIDDIMQIQSDRGEAGKVEKATGCLMEIFNQRPPERSTQDGKTRAAYDYRSTAIVSAEISIETDDVGAKLSAGMRRRIITCEARPMEQANLDYRWAERSMKACLDYGGAPGELLINHIRENTTPWDLLEQVNAASSIIVKRTPDIERTQAQILAICSVGFAHLRSLCDPCVEHQDPSLHIESAAIVAADFGASQAHTTQSLKGMQRLIDAVKDLRSSNPFRFEAPLTPEQLEEMRDASGSILDESKLRPTSYSSIWGRDMPHPTLPDHVHVCITPTGLKELYRSYGITAQQIKEAKEDGIWVERQVRLWHNKHRPICKAFSLPIDPDSDPEPQSPDPSPEPFDHDPHNLREEPTAEELDIIEHFAPHEPPFADIAPALIPDPDIPTEFEETPTEPDPPASDTPDILMQPRISAGLIDHGFGLFEGDYVFTASWQWSTGTYRGNDCPELRSHIHDEAVHELHSTIEVLKESQDLVLGSLPDPSNPAWAQLEAFGAAKARGLWDEAGQLLQQALVPDIPADERRDLMLRYGKKYRLHVLARVRKPEWFIDEPA